MHHLLQHRTAGGKASSVKPLNAQQGVFSNFSARPHGLQFGNRQPNRNRTTRRRAAPACGRRHAPPTRGRVTSPRSPATSPRSVVRGQSRRVGFKRETVRDSPEETKRENQTEGGRGDEKDPAGWKGGGRRASFGYLGSGSSVRCFVKCPDESPAPMRLSH